MIVDPAGEDAGDAPERGLVTSSSCDYCSVTFSPHVSMQHAEVISAHRITQLNTTLAPPFAFYSSYHGRATFRNPEPTLLQINSIDTEARAHSGRKKDNSDR